MALRALVKCQQQLGEAIDKLEKSFKQTAKARRTEEFFKKRLAFLKSTWKEFNENNDAIIKITDESAEKTEYTEKKYFEEIKIVTEQLEKLYKTEFTKTFPDKNMQELIAAAVNETVVLSDDDDEDQPRRNEAKQFSAKGLSEEAEQTDRMYNIRGAALESLTQKLLMKHDEHSTEIELEYDLNKLEEATRQYQSIYEERLMYADDQIEMEGLKLENESLINVAERAILSFRRKLVEMKKTTNVEPDAPKLKTLKVRTFSGRCQDWVPFLNFFTRTIIENPKLTDIQRMSYLVDSLEGEPRRLIEHLELADQNFSGAMEIIMHRYNDERKIINNHLDAIIDHVSVADEVSGLKSIHDKTIASLHALKGQNISDKRLGGMILTRLIEKKLSNQIRRTFEDKLVEKRKMPELQELLKFIEERFICMESVAMTSNESTNDHKPANEHKPASDHKPERDCPLCPKQRHSIHQCNKFNKMTPQERTDAVQKSKLCKNCLKGHSGRCNVSANCNKCKGYHHVALHLERRQENNRSMPRQDAQAHVSNVVKNEFDVMLATAIVRAKGRDGEYVELRALIDQGSTVSFISEEVTQRLKLKRMRNSTIVTGIGAGKTETIHGSVNVCIKPRYPSAFETSVEALILSRLTTYDNAINQKWKHTEELALADPGYWANGSIDLILGADIFGMIVLDGIVRGPVNTPIAQETMFGWILSGRVKRTAQQHTVVSLISNACLSNQLEEFWKTEEIKGDSSTNLTMEEKLCEDFFVNTTRRLESGNYVTRLPFKPSESGLGKSRHIAVATLLQMEKRFKRDPQLKEEYSKCINEYIELNHMELAKDSDESLITTKNGEKCYECYYLPHHAVIKTTSSTTKLRVVFNASQKSSNGVSLNDLMMTGPTIQDDLMNILVRWRGHRIALAADIEKMYRQILVEEMDYNYQRIVWRNDEKEPIQDYRIKRVTFGNASAPFVAIRTIKQLAIDECDRFPMASRAAQSDFYVDDLITGTHTTEDAQKLQQQLRAMMKAGGMNLRKWASNNQTTLDGIPDEHREIKTDITIDANATLKMLGVQWDPINDRFLYKIKLSPEQTNYTKRELVSEVARIFDPLGWLSPVVILAKMRLQETWLSGIGWDEKIPNEMSNDWNEFKATLNGVNDITLPRYIGLGYENMQYELHGFCDASMKAYAAVVYLRRMQTDGTIDVHLIAAKSRVAPTKTISLPRLELCGAVLLGKLMARIKKSLGCEFETYAWTDSMIALAWITGDSHRWETFVANRTTMIQEDIPSDKWRHVGTKENPADMASRGMDATTLKDCALWWRGPEWLHQPDISTSIPNFETTEGLKKAVTLHTIQDTYYNDVVSRFSSLGKLRRVIGYCLRFAKNCRTEKLERTSGHITVQEIKAASKAVIKWAQAGDFFSEIETLKKRAPVKSGSKIAALNPFIDETDGILRVGGRIQSDNLTYNQRHPAILAYSNVLVELIIRDAHLTTLHGGNTLTLTYIRQSYWILKAKRAIKYVLRRCVKCTRFRAETQQQQMGNLPEQRTTEARPFLFTGVDFCGPFDMKASAGRGMKTTKGYVAIFICLVTKAIHIEAVSDLTSKAFIAALHRVISRRGHIAKLFSDNGTNFVGANKLIRDEYRSYLKDYQDEITLELTKLGMEWQFIPPSAPNFGGLWERGVQSIKYHLKRTVGDMKLTYEELTTTLNQIEACLNSRPLCALTEDPYELVLTPAHFLIGESLMLQPERDLTETSINRLQRWQLCQKIKQDFWRSWKDEYLTRLQQRTKWQTVKKNLEKDDVVLVKDERMPSSVWPLGRITETHSGKDGLVRVVDVKIGKKSFRRPVTKICLLPVRDDETLNLPGRDVEESTSRTTGHAATHHSFSYISVLLILAFLSCVLGFEVQKVKLGPALYLEKTGQSAIMEGRWNILAYYDLEQYFNDFEKLEEGIIQLNQRCIDMEINCKSLKRKFEQRMQPIKRRNELLTAKHHLQRTKRSIIAAFIGGATLGSMAYHWLTQGETSNYGESINNLKSNQDHLLELLRKQTSVLDITGNIMKGNIAQMNEEHSELRSGLQRLADAQFRNDAAWNLQNTALQLSLMLEAYADIQNKIIDSITTTNGRLHPSLVPPDQLQEQLDLILNHLPTGLRLPGKQGEEVMMHIFRTARVKIGVSAKKLIFRVTIPLLRTTTYWIWRVIPIPMASNGEFIQIQTLNDYVLVDQDNTTYYDLKKTELQTCLDDGDELICELRHPLYKYGSKYGLCEMKFIRNEVRHRSDCSMRRLPQEETWIQLDNLRTWIFAMDHLQNYTINCEDYTTTFGLTGTGLLTFTGNCSLDGKNIHISANQIDSRMTMGYVATSNVSFSFADERIRIDNATNRINMTDFDVSIRELREALGSNWSRVTVHDWHHYSIVYTFIIITGIIYATQNCRPKTKLITTSSSPGECTELHIPQHEAAI